MRPRISIKGSVRPYVHPLAARNKAGYTAQDAPNMRTFQFAPSNNTGRTDGRMDGWTDGRTEDRRTDGRTDGHNLF